MILLTSKGLVTANPKQMLSCTIHATLHININFINIYYLILASTVKKLKLSSP